MIVLIFFYDEYARDEKRPAFMKTVFFILSLSRRSIFNKTTLRALAFFSFVLFVLLFLLLQFENDCRTAAAWRKRTTTTTTTTPR